MTLYSSHPWWIKSYLPYYWTPFLKRYKDFYCSLFGHTSDKKWCLYLLVFLSSFIFHHPTHRQQLWEVSHLPTILLLWLTSRYYSHKQSQAFGPSFVNCNECVLWEWMKSLVKLYKSYIPIHTLAWECQLLWATKRIDFNSHEVLLSAT